MPSPEQIAQAQALEVPVLIQGATNVPGTDRRELFSENTKTILVLEDGAVLQLRSKVVVGQAIFIHNELNGREALCKVVEAPAEGEAGHVQLGFSNPVPGFWVVATEQAAPAAQDESPAAQPETLTAQHEAPPVQAETPAAHPETSSEDTLAMMTQTSAKIDAPAMAAPGKDSGVRFHEELVPAYEMVAGTSVAPSEAPAPPESQPSADVPEPSGQQIDAAVRQMSGLPPAAAPAGAGEASGEPGGGAELEGGQTEANLAALMARELKFAKFAAAKHKRATDGVRDSAPADSSHPAPGEAVLAGEAVAFPKVPLIETLTTGRNAIVVQVVGWVAIVVSLGLIWRAMKPAFIHTSGQPGVAAAPAKTKPAAPAPATAATSAKTPKAAGTASVPKIAIAPAAAPAASRRASATGNAAKIGETSVARDETGIARNREAVASGPGGERAAQRVGRQAPTQPNPALRTPARVLYQPQPSFPFWAKSLDLDAVVTIDATIDERGNVVDTRIVSGPRPLQRAAVQAVGLWQIAPAELGGVPVASHLVLIVQFQR
ncbi:MAG TPA: energy transducer TonB [Candidatus Acidoferrales bacterium]|nr:energy transducer TonB [Candidatus Acidoferrales bacterium]